MSPSMTGYARPATARSPPALNKPELCHAAQHLNCMHGACTERPDELRQIQHENRYDMNASTVSGFITNGTRDGATAHAPSGAALLQSLREMRDAAYAALRAEREMAMGRVDEIDSMLAEVDGGAGMAPATHRARRGPNASTGGQQRILAAVGARPGIATTDLLDVYGPNRKAGWTALSILRKAGKIRREGTKGGYLFFPVIAA